MSLSKDIEPPLMKLARRVAAAANAGPGGSSANIRIYGWTSANSVTSTNFDMIWPGRAIARLATPAGRAEFSLSLELMFPGWLVQFREAPKPDAVWPVAALALTPACTAEESIASNIMSAALRSSAGSPEACLVWQLAQELDRMMQGLSCRLIVGYGGGDALRTGGLHRCLECWAAGGEPSLIKWGDIKDIPNNFASGPGVDMQTFTQSFESLACAQILGTEAPQLSAPLVLPLPRARL